VRVFWFELDERPGGKIECRGRSARPAGDSGPYLAHLELPRTFAIGSVRACSLAAEAERFRPLSGVAKGAVMKTKKKIKSLLPRRTWKINPLTKVKHSGKIYSRRKAKNSLKEEV
jgi:hypothetical protein